MARVRRSIKQAFPELEPIFGGHGDHGGHRAPRDHTISFRLRDDKGQFRSNVVWLMPDQLAGVDAASIRSLVERANGKRR